MPNLIILGQRRQGKSTLAIVKAAQVANCIIIYDPNANYRLPGQIQVESPEHLEALLSAPQDDDIAVYRIGPFNEGVWDNFTPYAEVVWKFSDLAFIVDESHMLQTKNKVHPVLDRFMRRCPKDVWVVQTGHRMVEMNGASRFLVDELLLFHNIQASEVKLFEEQYAPVSGELLENLGDREYVNWSRSNAGRPIVYIQRDTRSWYIDLHNPNQRPGDRAPSSHGSGGNAGGSGEAEGQSTGQPAPPAAAAPAAADGG